MHNVSQGNPVEPLNTISIMNRMVHHYMLPNIDIYTYFCAMRTDIGDTIIVGFGLVYINSLGTYLT